MKWNTSYSSWRTQLLFCRTDSPPFLLSFFPISLCKFFNRNKNQERKLNLCSIWNMGLTVLSVFVALALTIASASLVLHQVQGNSEGDALYALRRSLSDPDNVLQSWDPNLVCPCTWFHVTCNQDNQVTRLYVCINPIIDLIRAYVCLMLLCVLTGLGGFFMGCALLDIWHVTVCLGDLLSTFCLNCMLGQLEKRKYLNSHYFNLGMNVWCSL